MAIERRVSRRRRGAVAPVRPRRRAWIRWARVRTNRVPSEIRKGLNVSIPSLGEPAGASPSASVTSTVRSGHATSAVSTATIVLSNQG